MDKIKKIGLILAVVLACIFVDYHWLHLIRWNVIKHALISLISALPG